MRIHVDSQANLKISAPGITDKIIIITEKDNDNSVSRPPSLIERLRSALRYDLSKDSGRNTVVALFSEIKKKADFYLLSGLYPDVRVYYERLNLKLGEYYYQQEEFTKALAYYEEADKYSAIGYKDRIAACRKHLNEKNTMLSQSTRKASLMNLQKLVLYYSRRSSEYYLVTRSISTSTGCGTLDTYNLHVILEYSDGKRITIENNNLKIVCSGSTYNRELANELTLFRFNLVIDNSRSIDPQSLSILQNTLTDFLQNMPPIYEAQVIRFSDTVQLKSSFSKDKEVLAKFINMSLPQGRNTALYDAVTEGVNELIDPEQKIPFTFSVVLTDGKDTGSRLTRQDFQRNITQTCRDNSIPLFIVGVTNDVDVQLMQAITRFGIYQHVQKFSNIDRSFDYLMDILKNSYVIRIPAGQAEFQALKTIYLVKEIKPGSYVTIQDIVIR